MGRGSSSSEIKVRKVRQDYTKSGQSSGSGGQGERTGGDNCLFSFRANITIPEPEARGVEEKSVVVIVSHHTEADRLDLFIRDRNFGPYDGPYASRIRTCIKKNYIYDGWVESIRKTTKGVRIEYSVQGRGG